MEALRHLFSSLGNPELILWAPVLALGAGLVYWLLTLWPDWSLRRLRKTFSEERAQRNRLVRKPWKHYSRTFVPDEDAENKTTREATEFFTPDSLSGVRWWRAFPPLIFGLGVLGVFGGLMYGVLRFDPSTHETVIESVKTFAIAAGAALGGLVAAIALAMALGAANRMIEQRIAGSVARWCEFLDDIFLITPFAENRIAWDQRVDSVRELALQATTPGNQELAAQTRLLNDFLKDHQAQSKKLDSRLQSITASLDRLNTTVQTMGGAMAQTVRDELHAASTELAEAARTLSGHNGTLSALHDILPPLQGLDATLSGLGQQQQSLNNDLQELRALVQAAPAQDPATPLAGLSDQISTLSRDQATLTKSLDSVIRLVRKASARENKALQELVQAGNTRVEEYIRDSLGKFEVVKGGLNLLYQRLAKATKNNGDDPELSRQLDLFAKRFKTSTTTLAGDVEKLSQCAKNLSGIVEKLHEA